MLTYTTLFIVSMIVAVIALVVYRVVSSSKSILSSKEPISLGSSVPKKQKYQTAVPVSGAPAYSGPNRRVAPASYAGITPAAPTEDVDWGWKESGNQVREQHPHHSKGNPGAGHCSLYEVDPTAPPKRNVAWPHREDKFEAGGTAYKVTRKVSKTAPVDEDSGKPWGW